MTTMPLHQPGLIPKEDFELGRLKPFSCSREAISAAIAEYVKPGSIPGYPPFSPRQQNAVREFQSHGGWQIGNPDNVEDIKKYFDIFNDAFFGGLLKGYCKIEFVRKESVRKRNYGGILGRCHGHWPGHERDPRFKLESPYVTITIVEDCNHYYHDNTDILGRIRGNMEVLVHEMLHAILFIYACVCDHGCGARGLQANVGHHDVAWQAAANAIERADDARRIGHLLGLSLDLGRVGSLVCDLQGGYLLPIPAVLESLDIDIVGIRKGLDWRRNQDANERKSPKYWNMNVTMPWKSNRCIKDEWTVDRWEQSFGYAKWNYDRLCKRRIQQRDMSPT